MESVVKMLEKTEKSYFMNRVLCVPTSHSRLAAAALDFVVNRVLLRQEQSEREKFQSDSHIVARKIVQQAQLYFQLDIIGQ